MLVINSALGKEIQAIYDEKKPLERYYYIAELHSEKDTIPVVKVLEMDVHKDFVSNFTDYVSVKVRFTQGVWAKLVAPFKNNLEMSIYRARIGKTNTDAETSTETASPTESDTPPTDGHSELVFERLKVVFLPLKTQNITSVDDDLKSQVSLDHGDFQDVQLQLFNRFAEPLRIKTIGGVFRNFQIAPFLRAVMSAESNKIIVDGKPILEVMDVYEKTINKDPVKNWVIPHNTLLRNLAHDLHNEGPGLYSAGSNSYFTIINKKRTWMIYPCYDTTRFNDDLERFVFYDVPSGLQTTEHTWRREGKITYVLITDRSAYVEDGEGAMMDKGVGMRMTDARPFMLKPVKMTKDGPEGVRNQLNHEVIQKDRIDNLNYAPSSTDKISVNSLKAYSDVTRRLGATYQFTWDHGDIDLIQPNMPCKVVFLEQNSIQEVYGVIIKAHGFTSLLESKLQSTRHNTSIIIQVFVEKAENKQYEDFKKNTFDNKSLPKFAYLNLPSDTSSGDQPGIQPPVEVLPDHLADNFN